MLLKRFLLVPFLAAPHLVSGQQLSSAEYFFDQDPGFGLGTAITWVAADSVSINTSIPVSGLSEGFHTLYLRSKNISGTWGNYQSRLFYIGSAVPVQNHQIVQAECFFDTDPGLLQGISAFTTPGDSISTTINLNTSGLTPGFHQLYVRVKDSSGSWSLSRNGGFFLDGTPPLHSSKIISGEYFYDSDPGYGMGFPISTGLPADSIQQSPVLAISGLTPGFHQLFLRVKDSSGIWSNYGSGLLFKEEHNLAVSPRIVRAEYFLNADPGQGNASQINLSQVPADSVQSAFNLSMTAFPPGNDTLYMRVMDSSGVWSFPVSGVFSVVDPAVVETHSLNGRIRIVQNPVAEALLLATEGNITGDAILKIVSSTGIVVLSVPVSIRQGSVTPVPVHFLPAGIYTVRVFTSEGNWSGRMVKQ